MAINKAELQVVTLQDGEEIYNCLVSKEEYVKIHAGDYELAHSVLQKAIERKNRLLAYKLLKQQAEEDSVRKKNIDESNIAGPSGLNSKIPKATFQEIISEDSSRDSLTNDNPSSVLETMNVTEDNSLLSNRWSENEVKLLIELHKENSPKFNDKKFRPKAIYTEFAKHFPRFSDTQLETKIKNLKKIILDNSKRTGRGRITWPHFSQLHDIFGADPENEPLSIASNVQGIVRTETVEKRDGPETNAIETNTGTPIETPKRKRTADSVEPEWFKSFRTEATQRHEERMSLQREFLSVFKNWANADTNER